jgi:hypothetical protein
MPSDPTVLEAFDRLFDSAVEHGLGTTIEYSLPQPRWQFICHIADTRQVVLHGSGDPGIAVFEPRQPDDTTVFGNRNAVYAASDGLWPMYFAILDRTNHKMSMINSSIRLVEADGSLSDPYYHFSISRDALEKRAFRRGVLYFLPRGSFVQQPPTTYDGQIVHIAQWASLELVSALAKIEVGPEDFPLLNKLRGHDDSIFERTRTEPDGFPWLDDE